MQIQKKYKFANFKKIQNKITKYDNFFLNGRFGNFRYVNMNDCIEMSFNLASDLSGKNIEQIISEVEL